MAIFGAEGVRQAMRNAYSRHAELARQQGTPPGTSEHEFALYGALASRYAAGLQPFNEASIWAELAPFMRLDPDMGLRALAEYVVYKEMSIKADIPWLEKAIRQGLSLWDAESRQAFIVAANASDFLWARLAE